MVWCSLRGFSTEPKILSRLFLMLWLLPSIVSQFYSAWAESFRLDKRRVAQSRGFVQTKIPRCRHDDADCVESVNAKPNTEKNLNIIVPHKWSPWLGGFFVELLSPQIRFLPPGTNIFVGRLTFKMSCGGKFIS